MGSIYQCPGCGGIMDGTDPDGRCRRHVAPPAPVAKSAEVVGSGPVQTAAMQEAFRDERWRHTGTIAPPPFPSPAPVDLTAEEREMRMMAKLPSIGEMSDWLREHGFRIVREG